jgi:hypothetical protein
MEEEIAMREPPHSLANRVAELVSAISADPYGIKDPTSGKTALSLLRDLYDSMAAAGTPDPFLTEVMADETVDDHEAIDLYVIAIEQCASFPGEPTHTKRRDMALRLLRLGETDRAREQLELAIVDAGHSGDMEETQQLAEFLQKLQ